MDWSEQKALIEEMEIDFPGNQVVNLMIDGNTKPYRTTVEKVSIPRDGKILRIDQGAICLSRLIGYWKPEH